MKTFIKLVFAGFLAMAFNGCAATTPAPRTVAVLENARLIGELSEGNGAFTLTGTARVSDSKGGSLELLSGAVAVTEIGEHAKWKLNAEGNKFVAVFERAGSYPIKIKFQATVKQLEGWQSVDFHVAPSALSRIVLQGLGPDTKFEFPRAARPERSGTEFLSYVPSDGMVNLAWKESQPQAEGKLFYSAEMLSQISVAPGLMRQTAIFDFRIMQGDLSKLRLRLLGEGEVTRVQGEQVLAWNVEPGTDAKERWLVVQFNQAQKTQFGLLVQMQTPLGAFPQTTDAVRLQPDGATRFAGYVRIVNDGAVRLEVAQARGLSQISPEQFPETDATRATLAVAGSQRFAYRFSDANYALRVQADQILPELTVSEVLTYRLGENELSADAEIELDVREAPLRELVLRVPKGYAVARLTASGLTDYFLRDPEDQPDAELRLVYGQPVTGRQLVQLRLERNKPLAEASWVLPRVEVARAKSTRGHIGIAADAGFRLTPERVHALTEIATAFFPRKVPGLQTAFRLNDPAWQATAKVERLPQTVQADALHLFSIGEGVAYGSSLINYTISGAPVSVFRIELADEYFNVEFTGKDIRSWQKKDGVYLVQLHTPVSGSYALLATYERPFKSQGETLTFAGARPLDAQTEQGHTLVVSAYQFQVTPKDISPGLLALEPAEVPSDYRLFFDAPILAAYRYAARPFNLKLELSPLAQGDSLNQVVDRASIVTHISKEGQMITDARYFLKNRGNPHFGLILPPETALWSVRVNGATVVPVIAMQTNLIPLPQQADPNAVITLDVKLAARSKNPGSVSIAAPAVSAPVMLTEWKLEPDTGQRLAYSGGSLTPVAGVPDVSGFAQLARACKGDSSNQARHLLLIVLVLLAAAVLLWRWGGGEGSTRFASRHVIGTLLGFAALIISAIALANLASLLDLQREFVPNNVTFLAPVQQAGNSLTTTVLNQADESSAFGSVRRAWPALFAIVALALGWMAQSSLARTVLRMIGWGLAAWAALRCPNGAVVFLGLFAVFVVAYVVVPALRRIVQVSRSAGASAPAATALIIGGLLWQLCAATSEAAEPKAAQPVKPTPTAKFVPTPDKPPQAESIIEEIRVEDGYAMGKANIHWIAEKGEALPLLFEPAVLTGIQYPSNSLDFISAPPGTRTVQQLLARKAGTFDVEVRYQIPVLKRAADSAITLPIPAGLVHRLDLTVNGLDVDVVSPQAASVRRELSGSNTVANLVFVPSTDISVAWKPRSRDVKREKAVFYADLTQLYVPAAGVIEGLHYVSIRPAQGELAELTLDVPAGATITDVLDATTGDDKRRKGPLVSLWRFDPDARKLRVTLNPPQSRPFALWVKSQVPAGTLPFSQSVGLLSVAGTAGQIGLLGVATGNEVQLDTITGEGISAINLEDFPAGLVNALQMPGLAVRRAFRYADPKALVALKASAVEPDVRVDTQDTLSLGEDRTVLASEATVNITRAGIFRLSFVMPAGFEVEAISGSALSHWTESRTDAGKVITLNLTGKTEGQQKLSISLAGPGVKATQGWTVPQIVLREASKQRGTLLLVPEQGMRLQVATREGATQLDPQQSGIRQKGVLAFRILQTPWTLTLDLERVDAWVQVTSLQHATVNEAQIKVAANLQYQIENTGLKALHVYLPTNAESVRFQGEQVADFLQVAGAVTNGLQEWEIKLHRRMIGTYLLQASYQVTMPDRAAEAHLRGVEAADVNLQRGFVTIVSSGRLQLRVDQVPAALQPTEWQSIPRALRQDISAASANFTYRLVEPAFDLPVKLERFEPAPLLAARVTSVNFSSVISDDGVMLTQVQLEMQPGDKRLLEMTLPANASFWFAFVNRNGVWPWRKGQENILIPLEQSSHDGKPIQVEIFYSCQLGKPGKQPLDLELLAPKFDLPLENLTWRVAVNEKWKVPHWAGSFQLAREDVVPQSSVEDATMYLKNEADNQQLRTREAEALMTAANSAIARGEPQQARRAFQAAYGLSTHDAAFNEDARVQLHNIKLQEALVGLNVRQATASGESGALGGKLRDLRNKKEVSYTQQDAKDMLDRNTADDNAASMRLAERLIQQQDAAVSSATAIRANLPEHGRVLTFKRAVVVDSWADLKLQLKTAASVAASLGVRILILVAAVLVFEALIWATRSFRKRSARA